MFEHQKELNKTTPESEETIIVIEERISEELKFLENLYYEFNQIDENKKISCFCIFFKYFHKDLENFKIS